MMPVTFKLTKKQRFESRPFAPYSGVTRFRTTTAGQ